MNYTEKTPEAIALCLKYSENPEQLSTLIDDLQYNFANQRLVKYFTDDKQSRHVYDVTITRNGKSISFTYGDSVANTEIMLNQNLSRTLAKKRKGVCDSRLYSILACVASDYYCDPQFKNFCADFGYDTDSRKAFDTWQKCLEQSEKLRTIFTDSDIECLPQ